MAQNLQVLLWRARHAQIEPAFWQPGAPTSDRGGSLLAGTGRRWLPTGLRQWARPRFLGRFSTRLSEAQPAMLDFWEVVAPVEEQAQFSGSMHGTLDFLTCQILRETFALRTRPVAELASYLCASRVGSPAGFSRPAFIDNHDMNRFIFTAEEKLDSLHAALRLLYLLPEAPIVYYGSEIPLSQKRSIHAKGGIGFDEGRVPMPWDQPTDTPTAALLRELAQVRQENSWLWMQRN